ncbi:hypothetical protein ACFL6I_22900 [candidate division KSB1 bacterium]
MNAQIVEKYLSGLIPYIAAAVLACCCNDTAIAQNLQAGAYFTTGHPRGEFNDNVDNIGLGGSGYVGYLFDNTPVMLGMDIGYMIYGRETRNEPFSLTIPDVYVDVTTSNNIFLWHAFLRLQAEQGKIQPYLDGLFGFKYLFTDTSVRSENNILQDIATSKNLGDFAMSYGVGGGLRFRVYEKRSDLESPGVLEALIDFKFSYLFGSEAEYLKKGAIFRDTSSGTVAYDVQQSKTDMLLLNFGVTIKFGY